MADRKRIKKLARGYMRLGDTPRQAMQEACAFRAGISRVLGSPVPATHLRWADRRLARLKACELAARP